jgi:predicted ATP-dependent endonuclease of OLD family
MALGINLRDKSVEVPINEWGSGTQNRTHILMAVLKARRIKATASPSDRITPMVIVEEPESFLHPSAQMEFGRILRHLSAEFGIQIIATTHSPYMLNQESPNSNVLLSRAIKRGKVTETFIQDTAGENWMAPFADHLGIKASEFSKLRTVFSTDHSKTLLVEGVIDREYFSFLQQNDLSCEKLAADIEIQEYGGKDTLKNTVLLKFVLGKFDRVFVTYDLDAENECRKALARAGLMEIDYCALGLPTGGKDCIEGLLPKSVLDAVNGRETDLVMKLGSNQDRKAAKEQLKRKYLDEFTSRKDYSAYDLSALNAAIKKINKRLCGRKNKDVVAI